MPLQQVEPSHRILNDYVENLQREVAKLGEEILVAHDEEFRHTLKVRFALKMQLIEDLQRCIGMM